MPDRPSLDVITEALGKAPERKFTETVELSVNVKDLDLSSPKNRVEDEIPLPNGRGKTVRVAVIGSTELCAKVRNVADLVITSAELDEFAKGAKKAVGGIDFFLAEAPLMPTIGKRLGVVLGPRGKMPRPVRAGERSDESHQRAQAIGSGSLEGKADVPRAAGDPRHEARTTCPEPRRRPRSDRRKARARPNERRVRVREDDDGAGRSALVRLDRCRVEGPFRPRGSPR